MLQIYKPLNERTPDDQYSNRLNMILANHILAKNTPQRFGALTRFGSLPPMEFDLANGVPLITERSCERFWRKAVAEIIAFINGARTTDEFRSYGCDFWDDYDGKGTALGLADPNDMGPGSYGAAFHDFPMPDGSGFNQLQNIVDQIREYPHVRSHRVTPWIPYYTRRGPHRKVEVTPCHGWMHWRVLDNKLHLSMYQYSADMPIGVPSNMIQYAALLLMMCEVTGYEPGTYCHGFSDAHIYENQVDKVRELLGRSPRPFPRLFVRPRTNLFDYRVEDFELDEYNPHPGMKIPYAP